MGRRLDALSGAGSEMGSNPELSREMKWNEAGISRKTTGAEHSRNVVGVHLGWVLGVGPEGGGWVRSSSHVTETDTQTRRGAVYLDYTTKELCGRGS